MDYFPLTIYTPKVKYWPVIDNALKVAAIERKIAIKLLISKWKHSRKSEDNFLKALEDITDSYGKVQIEVVSVLLCKNLHYLKQLFFPEPHKYT